jgi:hypothetical protein
MIKAYKQGYSTAPLISNIGLAELLSKYENGVSDDYSKYCNMDISIVVLQAGATNNGVNLIKGYMQERAFRGKATVIFTNNVIKTGDIKYQALCSLENEECLHLAKFITVIYKKKEEYVKQEPVENKSVVTMADLLKKS